MEKEREVDLRPVILAVIRDWRILTIGMVLVALGAIGWLLSTPVHYVATAQVIVSPTQSETSFASKTNEEAFESAVTLTGPVPQQAALAASMFQIARSGDVLSRTLELLDSDVRQHIQTVSTLDNHLSAIDDPRTGIITLRALHPDRETAITIANTWAAAFVDHGNQIYSATGRAGILTRLQPQYDRSRELYQQREQDLADFIIRDESRILEQRIGEYRTAIDSLRLARRSILSATASADAIYATELISSYTDLRWSGYTTVISEANRNDLLQLSNAYDALRRLEQLRPEAQALRDHLAVGGDPQSAGLALQLLKVRAFWTGEQQNQGVQLQVPASSTATVADVDSVIATIDERLDETRATISQLNDQLTERNIQMPLFEGTADTDGLLRAYVSILGDNLLQRLVASTALTDSLSSAVAPDAMIIDLQRRSQQMEAELQRLQARRFVLEQERDTAKVAYMSLGLKIAELRSTNLVGEQVVRLASNAAQAPAMERSSQYLQIGLVLFVVFLALVLFSVLRALASTWLRASR